MSTRAQTAGRPSPLSDPTLLTRAPDDKQVAFGAMELMRIAQAEGRRITALDLARTLEVRRVDVRRIVSDLDRRGLVDALRMRLTLLGFAYVAGARVARPPSARPRRSEPRVLRAA
jgi:DNA-binding Lrp family transcriptional regulator